jgi:hypothetical protein
MNWFEVTHSELVDMCVKAGLIDRPVILKKERGCIVVNKLWRKRELIQMLEELEEE